MLVSLSRGAERSLLLAAEHPERVAGDGLHRSGRAVSPAVPRAGRARRSEEPRETYDGWGKFNRHYWVEHYEDFLEFFFSQCLTEPHSTKPHEDTSDGGSRRTLPTLVATQLAPGSGRGGRAGAAVPDRLPDPRHPRQRRSHVRPWASGARLAELANGALAVLEGAGHLPHARDPVKVNLLLRDFIGRSEATAMTATRRSGAGGPTAPRTRPSRPRPPSAGFAESPDGVRHRLRGLRVRRADASSSLPSTPIVHSRQWKGQVPYLSRHPGRHLRRPRQRPVGPPDRSRRLPRTRGWSTTSRP